MPARYHSIARHYQPKYTLIGNILSWDTLIVTREFTRWVVAVLCCLPAISMAANDDPKEIDRLLAKVRNEPIIFVLATGEPNACGRGCSEWIAGEGQFDGPLPYPLTIAGVSSWGISCE